MNSNKKLCSDGNRLMKDIGKAWDDIENTFGNSSPSHYKNLLEKEALFSNHLKDCKVCNDACEVEETEVKKQNKTYI